MTSRSLKHGFDEIPNGEYILRMSAISMTVSHLNAPYGPIVTDKDLTESLLTGSIVGNSPTAKAIISQLFIEVSPALVLRCANEAGGTVKHADMLYKSALKSGVVRNPDWEQSVHSIQ